MLKAGFAPRQETYAVPFGNGLKPAYEVLRHRALTMNTCSSEVILFTGRSFRIKEEIYNVLSN
jgi:hypothetical protein